MNFSPLIGALNLTQNKNVLIHCKKFHKFKFKLAKRMNSIFINCFFFLLEDKFYTFRYIETPILQVRSLLNLTFVLLFPTPYLHKFFVVIQKWHFWRSIWYKYELYLVEN